MRQNKFRIWDKIYKSMFQVSDISWACDGSIVYINGYIAEDVILMQSTGLSDRNGKEIFEGDIIRTLDCEGNTDIDEVFYNSVHCKFLIGNKYVSRLSVGLGEYSFINIEIISNIYDSPELLEVVK